jgi:hypothetical protein
MSDPMSQWLATGTTRTSEVTLFADQVGVEKLIDLYTELGKLNKSAAGKQRAVGEKSRRVQLEKRIAIVEAEVAESRSVWTLRALTRKEMQACLAKHPDPEPTTMNPRELTGEELAEYQRGCVEAGSMRTLELISKAVVSVEFASETVDAIPVDTLKAMLDAEYGDFRIRVLNNALKDAGDAEKGMPVPKS